ncbi:MAG: hypothetical protein AAFV32_02585 [Myxococcota bacterium]
MDDTCRRVLIAAASLGALVSCGSDDPEVSNCQTQGGSTVAVGATAPCADVGDFFTGTATCSASGSFDTSSCNGSSGGDGVACRAGDTLSCDDELFAEDGFDFVSGTASCPTDGTFDVSACVSAEYGLCIASGGSACEPEFACPEITSGLGLCVRECDPAADTCPSGYQCNAFSEATSGGACAIQSQGRHEACDALTACSDSEAVCEVSFIGESFGNQNPVTVATCETECDFTNYGESTGCTGGELCLRSPTNFVEVQEADGSDVTCADDDDCDMARGFGCGPVNTGAGAEDVCFRPETLCGSPAPIRETRLATNEDLDENVCGDVQTGRYCPPRGDADVRCASTFSSIVFGDGEGGTIACVTDTDCSIAVGFGTTCDSAAGVCVRPLRVCVALCDDPEGGPDLDCGEGFECAEISVNDYPGQVDVQLDSNNSAVACAGTDDPSTCDASEGYDECWLTPDGPFCAQTPRKICVGSGS